MKFFRTLQSNQGDAALKLIALGGIASVVLLSVLAQGIQTGLQPNESQRVPTNTAPRTPFNAPRAFEDLKRIVAFGPRPSGSPAHAAMRDYLEAELNAAGLRVERHAFTAKTPLGDVPMVNLIAHVEGTKPGVILIGNHYDTKVFKEFEFVGANDAGSTTAWMLEFARTVGGRRSGRSLMLCWFDGEEAFVEWSPADSLYGSRTLVSYLQEQKRLVDIHAMINVDMIGDCYLGVFSDPEAPKWLSDTIWTHAKLLGYGKHFLATGQVVEDDHIPFRRAGIPTLELIDFRYGGSIADHQRNWHTPEDTLERNCPGSLQAVGDVIYDSLPDIDAALDAELARRQ